MIGLQSELRRAGEVPEEHLGQSRAGALALVSQLAIDVKPSVRRYEARLVPGDDGLDAVAQVELGEDPV
jgi:hypothetical protein